MNHISNHLSVEFEAGDKSKSTNSSQHFRTICDGPNHAHEDHVGDADLVTSGGYQPPKQEAIKSLNALPLSAWTPKEVIHACRHLFNAKSVQVKKTFDVCAWW
jgi:hypothetical protein